jgi:hypothetical protein
VDEEPGIRTNTTILLGNIASYMNDGVCLKDTTIVLFVFLVDYPFPCYVLPPSQIIRHSKNLGESKDLKFD